jgi:hypothetical protein
MIFVLFIRASFPSFCPRLPEANQDLSFPQRHDLTTFMG